MKKSYSAKPNGKEKGIPPMGDTCVAPEKGATGKVLGEMIVKYQLTTEIAIEYKEQLDRAVELLRTAHIYVKGNIPAMIISGDITDFLNEIDGDE